MRDIVVLGAGDFGKEVAWLIEEINQAESFCFQVKNSPKEDSYGDKMTEDQKNELNPLVEALEEKIKTRNVEEIKAAKEALEKVFQPIITKIYEEAAKSAQANQGADGQASNDNPFSQMGGDNPFTEAK